MLAVYVVFSFFYYYYLKKKQPTAVRTLLIFQDKSYLTVIRY